MTEHINDLTTCPFRLIERSSDSFPSVQPVRPPSEPHGMVCVGNYLDCLHIKTCHPRNKRPHKAKDKLQAAAMHEPARINQKKDTPATHYVR